MHSPLTFCNFTLSKCLGVTCARECLSALRFDFPSASFFVICFVTFTDSFLNSHRNSKFLPRVPHLSFTDVYRSLDSLIFTNSVDMSLSKLQEIGKGREAWPAAIHGVAKSRMCLSNWTTTATFIGHLIFAKYYIETFTALLWRDPPSNFINSTSQMCQFPKHMPRLWESSLGSAASTYSGTTHRQPSASIGEDPAPPGAPAWPALPCLQTLHPAPCCRKDLVSSTHTSI